MRDTRVAQLVRDLVSSNYESEYLTRLRRHFDTEQAYDDLEREILYEMACGLGRAEEKVNVALLRLELARRDLEAARSEREYAECAQTFNSLREAALQARYDLLVHREAIGMRRNEILEQLYPIPPRVRYR
jgi:hypothetical protein